MSLFGLLIWFIRGVVGLFFVFLALAMLAAALMNNAPVAVLFAMGLAVLGALTMGAVSGRNSLREQTAADHQAILLKCAALGIGALSLYAWVANAAGDPVPLIIGWFFLSLFASTFFAKKHLLLCLGMLFLFPVWLGWATGEVIRFGRYGASQVLAKDPAGYWTVMVLWLATAVATIAYGVHSSFMKKHNMPKTEENAIADEPLAGDPGAMARQRQRPKPNPWRAAASFVFLCFTALLIYLVANRLEYVGFDNPVVLVLVLFLPVVLSLIAVLWLTMWLMNLRMKKRLAALETPENLKLLAEFEADLRRKYQERLAPINERLANPAPLSAAEEQRIGAELEKIAKLPPPSEIR